jgi:hypothetical protein
MPLARGLPLVARGRALLHLFHPVHHEPALAVSVPSVLSVSSVLNPLQSADPQNVALTLAESALPNLLDLKSFIIRTSKKIGGQQGLIVNQTSDEGCLSRLPRAESRGAAIGNRGISLGSDADTLVCSFDHATMALYTVAPCDPDNASVSANLRFIFNCHRDVPGALLSNEGSCTKL